MALIDQRILIDAPTRVVWEHITDPVKLAGWHAGYARVSILTTQQAGAGTRRRCALAAGDKDVIEEITHWVEGLGYEYVTIEGGPFRAYQGRFRLQPGPDGTSVQWTISYEPKGLMGTLRDRFGGRKALAAQMAASLRELRHRVDALGLRMDDDYRSRVGMQDRLNATERAQYQRRHAPPPGVDPLAPGADEPVAESPAPAEMAPPPTPEPAPEPAAPPPPIPDAAPASAPPPPVPAEEVPSFVDGLTRESGETDYTHTADTEPRPPDGLQEAIAAQQDTEPAPSPPAPEPVAEPAPPEMTPSPAPTPAPEPPAAPDDLPDYQRPTPPRGISSVRPSDVPADTPASEPTGTPPPVADSEPTAPAPPERPPSEPAAEETPPAPPPPPRPAAITPSQEMPPVRAQTPGPAPRRESDLPPPTPMTDTGEMSIWDVFGVRRPSEQDAEALDEVVRSVEARQLRATSRPPRPGQPVKAMARAKRGILGLRLRLALDAARVRLWWRRKRP